MMHYRYPLILILSLFSLSVLAAGDVSGEDANQQLNSAALLSQIEAAGRASTMKAIEAGIVVGKHIQDLNSTVDQVTEAQQGLRTEMGDINAGQEGLRTEIANIHKSQQSLRNDMESITGAQVELLKQLGAIRDDMEKMAASSFNMSARVEVLNASGIKGLGEWVAKVLSADGFAIFSVNDVKRQIRRPTQIFFKGGVGKRAEIVRVEKAQLAIRKQTRIFYSEGFIHRATEVGFKLPGSQTIMLDSSLNNIAEIKVVVGRDMKVLLSNRPKSI